MNREIKFRAWNETTGVMVPWEDLILEKSEGDNFYLIGHKESKAWIRYDHKQHLMQYTGLKDKNGVEIYEGDLVQVEGMFPDDPFKVWFGCGVFYIGNWNVQKFIKAFDFYEVVGNIYENPELL